MPHAHSSAKSASGFSKEIESYSFEQAMNELDQLVSRLEAGTESLEQAISDYTRGTELRRYCEKKLQEAELKVEKIIQSQDGTITAAPFDEEERA